MISELTAGCTRIFVPAHTETLTPNPRYRRYMNDSAVGADEVEHVAELARVDLTEEEVDAFTTQFADILEYFDALDEVPAIEHEPDLVNVMRRDEVTESLDQSEALQNAPESEDGQFKGPRVS
ncbi:MAG: aspartyl/glutamyl-tRNA(Asn/Gln) amidotransferase, C subunit [Haloquadratum walsbyi J07HQW1]|jgi:aspartyl/glutamyl-tRNA(Asn/Gln) amidotransferase subunit C (EC 6.3.5.-)|uniref:Aspartyl/glutamyl-tRNA(Asn/Gln) amidotransferase subunit C n=1 Tax=Haloquadratum walsbyi J07HQW1 TaxID=1238424 RepID=U1N3P7_9EURY|nr:MAG: aspartyl/glutamyl-tRNA(Asn/Gln) amidotransferase, C subunit [Haloquadratum walsbyi J07HQW1]